MIQILKSRSTGQLDGFKKKKKTYLYAEYKRLALDLKTHRLKMKGQKQKFHVNIMKRKLGQQYFYKIDFKIKTINKRHTRALHNHKGVNPTRQCNIFEYLYIQHRSN